MKRWPTSYWQSACSPAPRKIRRDVELCGSQSERLQFLLHFMTEYGNGAVEVYHHLLLQTRERLILFELLLKRGRHLFKGSWTPSVLS